MTLAYDIATGRLLGQLAHELPDGTLRLVTRDGRYRTVYAWSVRLEVLP